MNIIDNSNVSHAKESKELHEECRAKEKLEKELARKEKALAETIELFVLKNSKYDLENG